MAQNGNGGGVGTAMQRASEPKPATMVEWIQGHTGDIQRALPRGADADQFIRSFFMEYRRVPKLSQCTGDSVYKCFLELCELGLRLGPQKHAHLVPFGAECSVIVGYRGMVELARRSGEIKSVHAAVVHANDTFDYSLGLNPTISHVPAETDDPGDLTHAYAVFHYMNGGYHFIVLPRRKIEQYRACSKSGGSFWGKWYDEMAMKSAIRQASKLAPVSPELDRAVEIEDSHNGMIDMEPSDPHGGKQRIADLPDTPPTAPQEQPTGQHQPPEPKPATATECDSARKACQEAYLALSPQERSTLKHVNRTTIKNCGERAQLVQWTKDCNALVDQREPEPETEPEQPDTEAPGKTNLFP